MNTLRRPLFLIFSIGILLTAMASCQREPAHVKVTREFAKALYNFNFGEAEQYCTDQSIPTLRLIGAMSGLMDERSSSDYPITVEILSDTLLSDTTAWVEIKVINGELIHNSQDSVIGARDAEQRFDLRRSNKTWKVSLEIL